MWVLGNLRTRLRANLFRAIGETLDHRYANLTAMNEIIEKIRSLLDALDDEASTNVEAAAIRAFSGLELPDIMRDVVDLLMPELRPYEAAVYIHLLRHSIIESGSQHIRVSRRGLQDGVIKSAYTGSTSGGKAAESTSASFKTVQNTLTALVAIGALREEGAATREGTLYRVMLPEEIAVCRSRRDSMTVPTSAVASSEREADFYNVRENRAKIWDRDGYQCKYCGSQLTRFTATLDHIRSVKDGGDNSYENLVTACLKCNSKKNHQLLGDFLADTSD